MYKIKQFLKQLFCKHKYEFIKSYYSYFEKKKAYKYECSKCKNLKIKYRKCKHEYKDELVDSNIKNCSLDKISICKCIKCGKIHDKYMDENKMLKKLKEFIKQLQCKHEYKLIDS